VSRLLAKPDVGGDVAISHTESQVHNLDGVLDRTLIEEAAGSLEQGTPVRLTHDIHNTDRTTGAMLSGRIAKQYGHIGLPDDTIHIDLHGSAGQSFGAWAANGLTLELAGDANDYTGKGLSGGRLIVYPPKNTAIVAEESMIVGNVALYGAISGEAYFRGIAAERFAVRNSGAWTVVEGVGDHGCEYMTGGVVVVLGPTGRNFAAGMSGGVAYVLDVDDGFSLRVNPEMVELQHFKDPRSPELRAEQAVARPLEEVARNMLDDHAERLHLLTSNHARYTGSTKATTILENWDEYLPRFIKVMPTDYRRALTALKNGKAAGGSPSPDQARERTRAEATRSAQHG
jgi:glutamate synthase (NADPH/NADH) large chain